MPNSDPSPATRFQRGRAKTGGRQKDTPNKPKSIKIAMREFTDEEGDTLLAWARHVLYEMPDILEVGDKIVNLIPAKITLFQEGLRYGIGTPAKAAPEGQGATVQIVLRNPLGVDPIARRRAKEVEQDQKELRAVGGQRRQVAPRPLTLAILKAARAVPALVKDPQDPALDDLVPIGDNDPDVPDPPDMDIPSQ